MDLEQLRALVRDVPDFPQEGVVFKDITPLLADELAFSTVIDLIVVHFGRGNIDKVVGISCLIELGFLNGRAKLDGYDLFTLISY